MCVGKNPLSWEESTEGGNFQKKVLPFLLPDIHTIHLSAPRNLSKQDCQKRREGSNSGKREIKRCYREKRGSALKGGGVAPRPFFLFLVNLQLRPFSSSSLDIRCGESGRASQRTLNYFFFRGCGSQVRAREHRGPRRDTFLVDSLPFLGFLFL